MKKTFLKIITAAILGLSSWVWVSAAPPQLPQMFFGNVSVNGSPAQSGLVIIATVGGNEMGRITTGSGIYGGPAVMDRKLLVQGSDLTAGSAIQFRILNAQASESASFVSGETTNLNLTFNGVVFPPTPTPEPPFRAGEGVPGGGGGGGGAAIASPTPTPTATPVATPTPVPPQVAGATVFLFSQDLGTGDSGNDVLELQKKLTLEGVYTGPQTGFFGPLTEAAVRAYQAKKGIITTGFVGPLTRAELNKVVAGESVVNRQALIDSIGEALKTIADKIKVLIEELNKMIQEQVTPTPTPAPTGTPTPTVTPTPTPTGY